MSRGDEATTSTEPGVLYVVATPIGNLGDLTLRGIDVLKTASRIAAEDTRQTRKLLAHLGIGGKPMDALHAHSSARDVARVVRALEAGDSIALVTDAGTPSVSDPGDALVKAAIETGIRVVPIPGPSAALAALVASGLAGGGGFRFVGFLPREGSSRREAIAKVCATAEPVVLFESPERTSETLRELADATPDRRACVARELTKLHEELVRGSLAALATERNAWRGEIAIVLGPWAPASREETVDDAALDARIDHDLAAGTHSKTIAERLAAWSGRSKRDVYERVVERKRGHASTDRPAGTDREARSGMGAAVQPRASKPSLGLPPSIRACLFDMDGVLTATSKLHAAAWKETFDAYLRDRARAAGQPFVPFDPVHDFERYVDGKLRSDGVRSFLASRGIDAAHGGDAAVVDRIAERKDEVFSHVLDAQGVETFAGSARYVRAARAAGLRTAVVSSSKHCARVLAAANLADLFDAKIDGNVAEREHLSGKPAPDTYLAGARALGVQASEAAVFEDALAGVEAGRAGGFGFVVGVDRLGQADELRRHGADTVVGDLAALLKEA